MREFISIGSVPVDEPCAHVGQQDYREKAKEECRRYKELLLRKFGDPPFGACFKIKSFPHDFGTYYEVVVEFDDRFPESEAFAYDVDGDLPATWGEA